ncbi:Protein kinase-like domain [Pseudocohnilembus persalinus]|uniref:Protein kinase-like domain n=1 Tax=Pseudocohnilembus persalinus TaxID=266149 RepID=A0A0V0QVP6_PSEPJ|nr:Protein kinase-like domain [Pseudocohnilembus persalinus]|eukprot:KRX06399.1 Protein kinase-like domain [Pseudocohnilembus persalinus]
MNNIDYPYIASFNLEVDMMEGDHIFCENLEKQNFEIFNDLEDQGEFSFISCFWFLGEKDFQNEKNQTQLQKLGDKIIPNPNKKQPGEQFETDNEDAFQNKAEQNQVQQQFGAIEEQQGENEGEQEGIPSLEITQTYFAKNYKKIMPFYESDQQILYLYYDSLKEKLVTVKELKNQFEHIESIHQQIENERKRVVNAVRGVNMPLRERFQDKYDKDIKGLKRNIVREIVITYSCNQMFNKGINKFEGVIIGEKDFKIVYEFFGGSEIKSTRITSDLEQYYSKNIETYFQTKNYNQTKDITKEILLNVIDSVKQLHIQGVFMRDLQPRHILVRRRFDPTNPTKSKHEIQLIHFGKSKKLPRSDESLTMSQIKTLKSSSTLNTISQKFLTKPGQLFGKDTSDKLNPEDYERDDTFQLGILYFKLFQLVGLGEQLDDELKAQLQNMTGLKFEQMKEFQDIISKVKNLFKGGLEEVMNYENKIQKLEDIEFQIEGTAMGQDQDKNKNNNTTAQPQNEYQFQKNSKEEN